jgi:hypothetical protein
VSHETWDVFQEREAGSYLTNDPDGVGPHVSLVGFSEPLSSNAERLTRESGADDIDPPSPLPPVEGPHVVMDGEGLEDSVPLTLFKHSSPIRVRLDGADGSPSEKD